MTATRTVTSWLIVAFDAYGRPCRLDWAAGEGSARRCMSEWKLLDGYSRVTVIPVTSPPVPVQP